MAEVTVVRTPSLEQIQMAFSPGIISQYAGINPPNGWLLCNGQDERISDYPDLYNVLTANGTTFPYGANTNANGVLYFRLPNLKGRVPVGRDSSDPTFDTIGETGGAKTHTLSTAEMPVHTHIQNQHRHWISSASIDDRNFSTTGSNSQDYGTVADAGSYSVDDGDLAAGSNTAWTTATNQNAGGTDGVTQAHNNLQPFIVVNYIIKY